jgi:hypothetical protein
VSGQTGIDFVNTVSDSSALANRVLVQGGGVAFGDVDGDGRIDLYLCRTEGPNALYLNQGNWRFLEAATERGVDAPDRYSTGAVFADVDGDDDLDLLLNALGGPNALFLNDGSGHFTEQGAEAGLASAYGSTTSTLADVDGDGDLDLYTATYKPYTTLDRMAPEVRANANVLREVAKDSFVVRPEFESEYRMTPRPDLGGVTLVQRADPDLFYLNDGRGHFERVPLTSPRFHDEDGRPLSVEPEYFSLAARFYDVNGDRAPDLYVANDFEDPDEFWLNDGRGNFRLVPRLALRTTSNSSMAVDFADVDRNGTTDFFLVDMLSRDTRRLKTQSPAHSVLPKLPGDIDNRPQMQRNTLFLGRADGTWAEIAAMAGVEASGWSWSTLFLDVDLDGFEDLLVGTGHVWDLMDTDTQLRLRNRMAAVDWRRMLSLFPPLHLGNMAFRNRGDSTFEDVSQGWGVAPEEDISHGMAMADLDGDGDLDVTVNRLNRSALVLRNNSTAPRVAIRLRGTSPNTQAIGSRVQVTAAGMPTQEREVTVGGLYLSGADPMLTFATGDAAEVTITVSWRGGGHSTLTGAVPNRIYEITPAVPGVDPDTGATRRNALFEDRTEMLKHSHHESLYEEYSRQYLLPNGFGLLGPGVSWIDVDRDGDEDLLIGAGAGGRLSWFRNDGGRLARQSAIGMAAAGDYTTILGVPTAGGPQRRPTMRLLAGMSSYEAPTPDSALRYPSVLSFDRAGSGFTPARVVVPGDTSSVGPMALADYDGDGDLDLFVGGRVFPGAYPLSASSRLFRNEGGAFHPDTVNAALLLRIGMVSSAVFTDFDGDGDPDLLLAVEWGPLKLLINEGGRFTQAPESLGFSRWFSRWNGVATGDLDGDGRPDIIATSWGRNVAQHADSTAPLYIYFGRFGSQSAVDMLLARWDPRIGAIAPLDPFGRVGTAIPDIAQRLRTYGAYAESSIEQVLGPFGPRAVQLGASTMDHMVFLNRGDHVEARALPSQSQLAPAFYAGVADFDGDGLEDVFLSQNFFATEMGTPRYGEGRGILLAGDGRGGLSAISGQASGITVYGEQRGAAFSDYDGDGRLDLVVTQTGAETRLFRNVGASPGLRIRLIGHDDNPDAIGTSIRIVYQDRIGPLREVQAGSGYWSVNGATQVMGLSGTPTEVLIRWPGGEESRTGVPPGARQLTIRQP